MYSAKKPGVKWVISTLPSGSNEKFAPITTPAAIKGAGAAARVSCRRRLSSNGEWRSLGSSGRRRSSPPGVMPA